MLSAENIPEDIQVQAERLRTKYLEEALGRMVMATHEYEKSTKKVKATDKEFRKAKPKKLVSRGAHILTHPLLRAGRQLSPVQMILARYCIAIC